MYLQMLSKAFSPNPIFFLPRRLKLHSKSFTSSMSFNSSRQITNSSINHKAQQASESTDIKKPNLRNVRSTKGTKLFVAGILLMCVLIYPQIIKPLFSIGEVDERQTKAKELAISQTRPDNMPEWTSPFGPKRGKE